MLNAAHVVKFSTRAHARMLTTAHVVKFFYARAC
jgi:hypothetical protein